MAPDSLKERGGPAAVFSAATRTNPSPEPAIPEAVLDLVAGAPLFTIAEDAGLSPASRSPGLRTGCTPLFSMSMPAARQAAAWCGCKCPQPIRSAKFLFPRRPFARSSSQAGGAAADRARALPAGRVLDLPALGIAGTHGHRCAGGSHLPPVRRICFPQIMPPILPPMSGSAAQTPLDEGGGRQTSPRTVGCAYECAGAPRGSGHAAL